MARGAIAEILDASLSEKPVHLHLYAKRVKTFRFKRKPVKTAVDALAAYGGKVEKLMEQSLLRHADPEFADAILYPIRTGGKRVRPALTILSCLASGGSEEQAYPAAAAVELVHNYSLILDDIIDHSEVRRGQPTLWKKYGLSTAILVAVHYRETVSELLNETPDPKLFNEIAARTVKLIVDGERLDILFEQAGRSDEPYIVSNRRRHVSLNDYFAMIERKTAVLIQTACEFGALSARAPPDYVRALSEYGYSLGMAFQVGDDIIDIFGVEEKTGKVVGGDIREHKLGNIVLLLAVEEGSEKLREILSKNDVTSEDIKEAIELVRRTSARERAERIRNDYVQRALKALEPLPETEYKSILRDVAVFIMKREH
ncbi:MAG: polyprenyl synthetase family protein [Thermofilum sp.]